MEKTIIVCNQKGGSGKSTISIMLAAYLHTVKRKSVLLIDSDPQETIMRIKHNEEQAGRPAGFAIEKFSESSPAKWKAYLEANKKYNYRIVDTTGDLGGNERFYLLGTASTAIVFPFIMTEIDVPVAMSFLEDLDAIIGGTGKPVIGIINKAKNTKEQKYSDLLAGIAGMEIVGKLNDSIRHTRGLRFDKPSSDPKVNELLKAVSKKL